MCSSDLVIQSKPDGPTRRQIELAGMNAVMIHEKKRAKSEYDLVKIKDVSDHDLGYDIESFDRSIEVKSHENSGPVMLSTHEWNTAEKNKEQYWLYVVEDSLGAPKIHTIQNPFEKYKNIVRKVETTDFTYFIDDWKM